jgi:hypothetical protein
MATDEEEEYASATRLANWVSEAVNAAYPLTSKLEWKRFCDTVAASERKQSILRALSGLASVAHDVELPTLHGPKPMIRRLIAAAEEVQRLVAAWDDTTDPSAEMVAAASRVVACLKDPDRHLDLP